MEQTMPQHEAPQPTRAMRLIFEYEGNQVRLVSQQPVDMTVTGADLSQVSFPGYYVDTRDTNDKTLSRVVAHNVFSSSMEVFPEQPGQPITRVETPERKGAFTVIVPVPTTTDHVTLVQITAPKPGQPQPTTKATSNVSGAAEIKDIANFKINTQQ
jgi:hypothetical protein